MTRPADLLRLVVAVTVLAAAGLARGDAKQQAQEEMSKAQEAFDKGDFDEAARRFGKAHDLVPSSSGPLLGLGLAHARGGRCDQAVPSLEEYLKRKKGEANPEARSVLDDCKRKLAAPAPRPPARLIVTSDPPGAEVRIDDAAGAPVGYTPFESSLPEGRHRVLVSKPGFDTQVREVDGVSGTLAKLNFSLSPTPPPRPVVVPPPPPPVVETPPPTPAPPMATGTIVVDVAPQAATITVNGISVGEATKHYEGKFQHGVYNVLVERDGFRSVTFTASLDAGQTVTKSVKLSPLRSGAWLGLAIPFTILAAASGIAAIVTFYNADGHPPGSDFDTNASANAAMQGIFYPSLALAAAGYLAYGLLNRGKIADGPPLTISVAPAKQGGYAGLTWRF
jgi:hypothetical protein